MDLAIDHELENELWYWPIDLGYMEYKNYAAGRKMVEVAEEEVLKYEMDVVRWSEVV